MRAVVQRVLRASVSVEGQEVSAIESGLLVLVAVVQDDTGADGAYIGKKLCGLRIFEDEGGKMNRSIQEVQGSMLIVSQFTLAGDARHGNRPSFIQSAPPEEGERLYKALCEDVEKTGIPVRRGIFGADMKVALVNDGPVTILLDSRKLF